MGTKIGYVLLSLLVGACALALLHFVVRLAVRELRRKGGVLPAYELEIKSGRSLTAYFSAVEQFLFFLAAVFSRELFGWAAGGWLIFKGIHQYARWDALRLKSESQEFAEEAKSSGFSREHYLDLIARNQFMVFLMGSGLSIASGGIAGAVYHYVLFWLKKS